MTSFSFDDLVTDDKKTNTSSSTTSSTLPFSSLAPNQYNPNAQEIVNPTFPEKEPYVSAEEQMEALNLSQAQEQEPETISIKDLEEDLIQINTPANYLKQQIEKGIFHVVTTCCI